MKKLLLITLTILFSLNAQALFEVKDASDNTVLEISNDGLRVFNLGDTLMVISSSEIKAFIDSSTTKALSRSFSVTTSTASGKDALSNAFEVTTESAQFNSGLGNYTDFSPDNIFLGLNAGISTEVNGTLGTNNIFLGNYSGTNNVSGVSNVCIGNDAGYLGTAHHNNTFIGTGAGYNNIANDNVYVGTGAGFYSQTGQDNVFIGLQSGTSNDSGNSNVFIGSYAGDGDDQYASVGTGSDNVFVGDSCAYKYLHGRRNTFIGSKSGLNNISGMGNVFLGNASGFNETGSNKLYIDNSNVSTPLIYGEFDNDSIQINGNFDVAGNSTLTGKLGVGTNPSSKVHAVDLTPSDDTPAIYGSHYVTDYCGIGVRGDGKYQGVMGFSQSATDHAMGVYGIATGAGTGTRYGIYGVAAGGETAWAGYFDGNVNVTGTLSKGAGSFKIDHPLDPENKYLYHSFVESPDMKNIYDGVVILDNNGEAIVNLPNYFEALNNKFRYQLTAIGAPSPNLYIAQEVLNNQFIIAGGISGMKVSWMVTGIRIDNFANENRIPVEVEKEDINKGNYLHPKAYGLPKEQGIDFQHEKATKVQSKK